MSKNEDYTGPPINKENWRKIADEYFNSECIYHLRSPLLDKLSVASVWLWYDDDRDIEDGWVFRYLNDGEKTLNVEVFDHYPELWVSEVTCAVEATSLTEDLRLTRDDLAKDSMHVVTEPTWITLDNWRAIAENYFDKDVTYEVTNHRYSYRCMGEFDPYISRMYIEYYDHLGWVIEQDGDGVDVSEDFLSKVGPVFIKRCLDIHGESLDTHLRLIRAALRSDLKEVIKDSINESTNDSTNEPINEQQETTIMSKVSTAIKTAGQDNVNAALQAAQLKLGQTALAVFFEMVKPQIPSMARGYLKKPAVEAAVHLAIANAVNTAVATSGIGGAKGDAIAKSMLTAAYLNSVNTLDIEAKIASVFDQFDGRGKHLRTVLEAAGVDDDTPKEKIVC